MRYSGEHIAAMVISIISDAKNVFIPMSLFFIIFDFQVFIVIFNQNLEISDECDFLSFYFENSVFRVTMEDFET